jgi:hypothetical protein
MSKDLPILKEGCNASGRHWYFGICSLKFSFIKCIYPLLIWQLKQHYTIHHTVWVQHNLTLLQEFNKFTGLKWCTAASAMVATCVFPVQHNLTLLQEFNKFTGLKWYTATSAMIATCVFPTQWPTRKNFISANLELPIVIISHNCHARITRPPNYHFRYKSRLKNLCTPNKISGLDAEVKHRDMCSVYSNKHSA